MNKQMNKQTNKEINKQTNKQMNKQMKKQMTKVWAINISFLLLKQEAAAATVPTGKRRSRIGNPSTMTRSRTSPCAGFAANATPSGKSPAAIPARLAQPGTKKALLRCHQDLGRHFSLEHCARCATGLDINTSGMGHPRLLIAVSLYFRAIQDATTIYDRQRRSDAMMAAEQTFRAECAELEESFHRAKAYTGALNEEAGEKRYDNDHWGSRDDGLWSNYSGPTTGTREPPTRGLIGRSPRGQVGSATGDPPA
jgi:hypothetical protein